jgi:hypothetical protein
VDAACAPEEEALHTHAGRRFGEVEGAVNIDPFAILDPGIGAMRGSEMIHDVTASHGIVKAVIRAEIPQHDVHTGGKSACIATGAHKDTDGVAPRDQSRDEVLSDKAGRTRHENGHGCAARDSDTASPIVLAREIGVLNRS